MIPWLQRLLGYDDRFFALLEGIAAEARTSVELLVRALKGHPDMPQMDEMVESRRRSKRLAEGITEALCKTFITPIEREDIEGLSSTLYRIPKTAEKFMEKFLLTRTQLHDVDFIRQAEILDQCADTVAKMVCKLRQRARIEEVRALNDRLHNLEGEADKIMVDLIRDFYSGRHTPLRVIVALDLHGTLEKLIDRCRDAGNLIFQVVLKYA